MATSRRKTWLSLGVYAAWGVLNAILIVLETVRDDPRWWRFVLSAIFIAISVNGVFDDLNKLRAPEPVRGDLT
jgi:hypothetical protein